MCLFFLVGDLVGIRTRDPQLRRLLLYPAELRDQPFFLFGYLCHAFSELSGCKGTHFFTNHQNFRYFYKIALALMLLAEEVVDRLDGVEGFERHFHEDGGPVAHSTIPKPR